MSECNDLYFCYFTGAPTGPASPTAPRLPCKEIRGREVPYMTLYSPLQAVNITFFEAWLLSSPPLPSRQVTMADSCEWIFHLFGRHHCKSSIFETMENFQNDCCRSWTMKPFKNSYSRQLRIVNAVVCWVASRSDQLTEVCFSPRYAFWDDDDNYEWSQQRSNNWNSTATYVYANRNE